MTPTIALIREELSSQHVQRAYPEITPDMSLVDDLGCDALDLMSIAVTLETANNIDIRDCEIEEWRTVGDVVKLVDAKLRANVEG